MRYRMLCSVEGFWYCDVEAESFEAAADAIDEAFEDAGFGELEHVSFTPMTAWDEEGNNHEYEEGSC